jgi:hypothetical protein
MMVFLGELAIGLAYAWKKGALDWECRTHHSTAAGHARPMPSFFNGLNDELSTRASSSPRPKSCFSGRAPARSGG